MYVFDVGPKERISNRDVGDREGALRVEVIDVGGGHPLRERFEIVRQDVLEHGRGRHGR